VKRYVPLILLAAVALALWASGVAGELRLESLLAREAAMRELLRSNFILAIAAYVLIYAAVTAVSLPGALFMTLMGGYLFGTWLGGAATAVGATVGAVIAFYVVRTSLGATLRSRADAAGGRLKDLLDGFQVGAFGYVLTLRLLPIAPFWLVNVAAGLAHAPLKAYALATLIGILPATFVYSGIGAGLNALVARGETPNLGAVLEPQILLPLLALGALSLAGTLLHRRQRHRRTA